MKQTPRHPNHALIAGFVTMFSIGSLYAWSVFVTPLESKLGATRSEVSGVFSVAIFSFTCAMTLGPALYRYLSASFLGLVTGLLAAIGLLLSGVASDSLLAITIGFGGLFGIANGLGYGLSLQVVQAAAEERRGLMTGLAVAIYTGGSAVFSGLFAWGIAQLDVSATFMAAGVYMAIVAVAIFVLLRRSGVTTHAPVSRESTTSGLLLDRSFWILWFGFFFSAFAGVMVLGHAAPIVGTLGGATQSMALGAALAAAGNGVGRLLGGWLSDWQPPRRFLSAMLFIAVLALTGLLIWPNWIVAMIALTIMSVGYGSVAGTYPVIVSKIYGVENVSRVYGRVFTGWGMAGLAGPYVGGLLFDGTGDYHLAILTGAGSALVGCLICMAIRTSD